MIVVNCFKDSGNWSLIHSDQGLSCHDGFDIGGRCLQFSDLSSAKTCQQVLALVLRRVVSCAWPQLWYFTSSPNQIKS